MDMSEVVNRRGRQSSSNSAKLIEPKIKQLRSLRWKRTVAWLEIRSRLMAFGNQKKCREASKDHCSRDKLRRVEGFSSEILILIMNLKACDATAAATRESRRASFLVASLVQLTSPSTQVNYYFLGKRLIKIKVMALHIFGVEFMPVNHA